MNWSGTKLAGVQIVGAICLSQVGLVVLDYLYQDADLHNDTIYQTLLLIRTILAGFFMVGLQLVIGWTFVWKLYLSQYMWLRVLLGLESPKKKAQPLSTPASRADKFSGAKPPSNENTKQQQ